MFHAMCLLDLNDYQGAEIALLNLSQIMDSRTLNDYDDNSASVSFGNYSMSIDTVSGSTILFIDGNLQWLLKYHLAMCSYMQKDFVHSEELLSDCVTSLRSYIPDGFSLGSALFYHSISIYYNSNASEIPWSELKKSLEQCIQLLTECLASPWVHISLKKKVLCYLCRGKTYQRLKQYELSIQDLSQCIEIYEEMKSVEGVEIEIQYSDAAYAYFRRAWSYKV
jgi:hypothetical protein